MKILKAGSLATMLCAVASAGVITYTEQTTGSGTFGGTAFTNALVTIVVTSDTTTVNLMTGVFFNREQDDQVTVAGIGTGKFGAAHPISVFDNPAAGLVGIQNITVGDVLDIFNPAFATYTLTTAIGPVTGTPLFNPAGDFGTSFGNGHFQLTSAGSSTFTATTGTTGVPEPGSLDLLGIGVACFITARRRMRIRETA